VKTLAQHGFSAREDHSFDKENIHISVRWIGPPYTEAAQL
jgi:hypothetical protein